MARGANSSDSTVRLLNLVALLTQATKPMSIEEIANEMRNLGPEFRYSTEPDDTEGRRTMFNRDKKSLQKLGIDIVTTTLSGQQAGVGAYSINKDSYSLIDFGLTREEMEALQLAASVVQIEKPWGRQAVQWLGGAVEDPPTGAVAHITAESPVLTALFAAVRTHSTVTFTYHGRDRTVHPYGLVSRKGFWYLVGHDTGHGTQRTFRVDRIEGNVAAGEPGSFDRPDGFDIESAFVSDPKKFPGGEDIHATVRVDRNLVPGVVRELGEESIVARNDDGSVDFSVPCGNQVAFRSWLFSMVDRAVVLGPEDVRRGIIEELNEAAGAK